MKKCQAIYKQKWKLIREFNTKTKQNPQEKDDKKLLKINVSIFGSQFSISVSLLYSLELLHIDIHRYAHTSPPIHQRTHHQHHRYD